MVLFYRWVLFMRLGWRQKWLLIVDVDSPAGGEQ